MSNTKSEGYRGYHIDVRLSEMDKRRAPDLEGKFRVDTITYWKHIDVTKSETVTVPSEKSASDFFDTREAAFHAGFKEAREMIDRSVK